MSLGEAFLEHLHVYRIYSVEGLYNYGEYCLLWLVILFENDVIRMLLNLLSRFAVMVPQTSTLF